MGILYHYTALRWTRWFYYIGFTDAVIDAVIDVVMDAVIDVLDPFKTFHMLGTLRLYYTPSTYKFQA